jgi:hypothetical protein
MPELSTAGPGIDPLRPRKSQPVQVRHDQPEPGMSDLDMKRKLPGIGTPRTAQQPVIRSSIPARPAAVRHVAGNDFPCPANYLMPTDIFPVVLPRVKHTSAIYLNHTKFPVFVA